MITMKMRARLDPSFAPKVDLAASSRVKQAAIFVEGIAIQLCSRGGGSASGPQIKAQQYYYGPPKNDWVRASPEGQPPYAQTTGLKTSIRHEMVGLLSAIIGPTVFYGKYLEYGTKRMAARPFMRPALQKAIAAIPQFFRSLI